MKHLFIIILTLGFVQQTVAQNLYLVPNIGIKAEVNRNTFKYVDQSYFQITSPNITFKGLSPLLLGANIEYKRSKDIYGFGLIVGDIANSQIKVQFSQKNDNPYTNYKSTITNINYAGWEIVYKIPLIYKRELFSINNKKDPTKRSISCNLNTGINLQKLNVKNKPFMTYPISFGKQITDFGDSIELVGYSGHVGRSFNMSINLGLDFDFYIKGKRSIVAQLYFEQGFRKITQAPYLFYLNDQPWGGVASYSRGSAINFKLAFPIEVLKKYTHPTLNTN